MHKDQCPIINSYRLRKKESEVTKERSGLRKKYFEYFLHKVYDMCIATAEKLVELERKHIKSTREYFNELEYGVSVCLLARSLINIKGWSKAIITIQCYLQEKQHFLEDMKDIYSLGDARPDRKDGLDRKDGPEKKGGELGNSNP